MKLWDDILSKRPRHPSSDDEVVNTLKSADLSVDHGFLLERLFCPYGGRPQSAPWQAWALLCLVAEGVFSMEVSGPYTPKRKLTLPHPKSGRESLLHRTLKANAAHWLRVKHKVRDVSFEVPTVAAVSDVCSSDRRWLVECGVTRPSKVWEHYMANNTDLDRIVLFNQLGIVMFGAGQNLRTYRDIKRSDTASRLKSFADFALGRSSNPSDG